MSLLDNLGSAIKMAVNMLERDATPVRTEAAGALLAAFGEFRSTLSAAQAHIPADKDQAAQVAPAILKNAQRYEYLRYADLDALADANWKDGEVYTGEAFDAAIDAAISAAPPVLPNQTKLQKDAASTTDVTGGAA